MIVQGCLPLLCGVLLVGCQEQTPPQAELKPWQQGVLKVIVPDSRLEAKSAFDTHLANLLAKQLGVKLQTVAMRPDQIRQALGQHQAHLAAVGMTDNQSIGYSRGPIYRTVRLQAFCGVSTPENLEELSTNRLAVVAGSAEEAALAEAQLQLAQLRWESRTDVTSAELLEEVATGALDCTIANDYMIDMASSLHPGLSESFNLGESRGLAWAIPNNDPELAHEVDILFNRIMNDGTLNNLLDRHFGDVRRRLPPQEAAGFLSQTEVALPKYRHLFERASRNSDMDWRLLAATAYHESKWDPNATSPTNVRGMMMLTEDTANRLNVSDRLNPWQSIRGGAQYLKTMISSLPSAIQGPDRFWMGLAAYNQGMAHLEDARILAQRFGLNPNYWVNVKRTLPLLAQSNYAAQSRYGGARGGEAVFMVENIRQYYAMLKVLVPEAPQEDILNETNSARLPSLLDPLGLLPKMDSPQS